jgi:aryl-alcohol dehydrogenase-like predicted oxidoreductase
LLAQEVVTSVLIGPKSLSQLAESVSVLDVSTTDRMIAVRERMNKILDSHELPPLCPFPAQLV